MVQSPKSVELFTYALSPYGMKVYWVLIYKGIDFALRYVSPGDQNEIRFTGQRVVPVVTVDDEWKQDSGPICCWLDEHFPERAVAGSNDKEREAIRTADRWVSGNVLGLSFRSIIDDDTPFSAFRNGRKLARTMGQTSGGVPWWGQFLWYRLLRKTDFVVADANKVDRATSMKNCRNGILRQLEEKIDPTGFVAGTDFPSYADLSVFAQLVCNTTYNFEGALQAGSSLKLHKWYDEMCNRFELADRPQLVPGWQPYGL